VRALLGPDASVPLPEYFLPYHQDANPAAGLEAWQRSRILEPLQPAMEKLRELVIPVLERRGWILDSNKYVPTAGYGEIARFSLWVSRSFIHISVNTRRIVQEGGRKFRMYAWDRAYQLRFTIPEELDDDFFAAL